MIGGFGFGRFFLAMIYSATAVSRIERLWLIEGIYEEDFVARRLIEFQGEGILIYYPITSASVDSCHVPTLETICPGGKMNVGHT